MKTNFDIIYEYDTEYDNWDFQEKGYRNDVTLVIGNKKFNLCAMTMVRLCQEQARVILSNDECDIDSNIIIVNDATKDDINKTIEKLVQNNFFDKLGEMKCKDFSIEKKSITNFSKEEDAEKDNFATIEFGTYPQKDISGKKADSIEWLILDNDKENKKMLLLSKYVLDCKYYNDETYDIYDTQWKKSLLRKWINDSFYNRAFSSEEKEKIITTKVINSYSIYGIESGEDTEDKIFCLSLEECRKYFKQTKYSFNKRLACKGTDYANNIYETKNSSLKNIKDEWYEKNKFFWLRNVGLCYYTIMFVNNFGQIYTPGHQSQNCYYGIRPAMWILYD